ncbi:sugar kinase [Moellerella wisconsensis]|uniref:2-dehydro-3-deoxygluconokinase n=1 Tax=Moellerella wisconsensis ATCC 35017 TaxID=1354267 RepID=A0A0N1KII7_9GAMM|nr:sugar kinase [Moellerella wisconsensis]KPD03186.1 2-dehydro-3-deoxygluconate kinase [Moellerella wisconsensis ATCC 35017]VFS48986.1 Uncharacterized sugar kinase ydjH [Moellerella wisconsensis]
MNINHIAVIGECMVELQQGEGGYRQGFGGDTLNTALYLSRLTSAHGVTTRYITGLGEDPFSRKMLESWQQENINTDNVFILQDKLPGIYLIETAQDGERRFFYWRDNSSAKYWLTAETAAQTGELLSQQHMIYLSGISLAILPPAQRDLLFSLLAQAKLSGAKIAFDNNYRPKLWSSIAEAQQAYARILALTDMAFLTFDDEKLLYGDQQEQQSIERARALGVEEIVIKRGSEPCYVIINNNKWIVAANKVDKVVDTTAAGDSFSAGYLAKRVTGGTPEQAAKAGHDLASVVIQHQGAIIPTAAMPEITPH